MSRAAKACAVMATIIAVFSGWAAIASGNREQEQIVILKEGKIGRSGWGAWLEPAKEKKPSSDKLCRNLILVSPSKGGLFTRSEARECGAISVPQPVIESISGGHGDGQRTVSLALFSPVVKRIYVNIGGSGGRMAEVSSLSRSDAEKLKVGQLGYWVRGYTGNDCIHRLIAYDAEGVKVSDSGKEKC